MVTIKEIRNKRSKRLNTVNEDDVDEHRRNIKYEDDDDDDSSEDDDNDDNDSSEEEDDDNEEEQESLHNNNDQLNSDDNDSEFDNDTADDTDDEDTEDDTKKMKHNDIDDDEIRNLPLGERLRRQMEQGDTNNTKWKQIRKEKHENNVNKNTKLNMNTSCGIKKDNTLSTSTKEKEKIIKKSKHAPKEMSSKRKDFYYQQKIDLLSGGCTSIGTSINVHANLYKPCDPRSNNIITATSTSNSSRGGKKLLESLHDKNDYQYEDYAFIQEMRHEEIRTVQKRIKAYQMTGRKGQEHRKRYNCNQNKNENGLMEDQKLLHQLLQEKANYERKQLDITTKRIVQETIYKKRKHDNSNNDQDTKGIGDQTDHQHSSNNNNKKKYVPKAREVKRMYIETKYDLLQQQKGGQNKIDKIIYKKHLKNKSKDSKFM